MPIRFVLFDAAGTLILPTPSVAAVYRAAGARFGSQFDEAEIAFRFRTAYGKVIARCSEAGTDVASNEALERQRWQEVVQRVFDDVSPDAAPLLFESLWDHFASPHAWRLADDAAEVWSELRQRGYVLGVASNFDARLRTILAGKRLLAEGDHLFLSTELGYAKPSLAYYRGIEERLGARPEEIMIVGDDLENDVLAPQRALWRARLVTSDDLRSLLAEL
jgi:putative hydrolase of the HAD superfamily